MFNSQVEVLKVLSALGDEYAAGGGPPLELVVCGGAALQVLGLVDRATQDVDVLAIVRPSPLEGALFSAQPLPERLLVAAGKVAPFFRLPKDWLNSGPTSALDLGLPENLLERAIVHSFGPKLVIRFLSRVDQIHFKLYAAADQRQGKHLDDLIALKPTDLELEKAARWTRTHDPSEGYLMLLREILIRVGHPHVADGL